MATSLNDGQLATLGDLVHEGVLPYELQDLSTIYSARSVLRLYASLASIQRQALRQGKAIRAAQMTPAQRDLLVAALRENSLSGPTPLDLTSLAAGSLSLTAERCVQIREQREGSTRYYTEPAIGPAEPPAANERVVMIRHPVTQVRLQFEYGSVATEIACLTIASPALTRMTSAAEGR